MNNYSLIMHAKIYARSVVDDMVYYDFISLYFDNKHVSFLTCIYDYIDAYCSINIDSNEGPLSFNECDLYIETLAKETLYIMQCEGYYAELIQLINENLKEA